MGAPPVSAPSSYGINSRSSYQPSRSIPPPAVQPYQAGGSNAYNPPKTPEVYTLTDRDNATIPNNIRDQFPRDDQGRVLFFTTPPVDLGNSQVLIEPRSTPGNSLRYQAKIIRENRERRKAAKEQEEARAKARADQLAMFSTWTQEQLTEIADLYLQLWAKNLDNTNIEWYKRTYGPGWEEVKEEDRIKLEKLQAEAAKERQASDARKAAMKEAEEKANAIW